MTVNEALIPINVREAMRKYYDQIHLMAADAEVRRAREKLMSAHTVYTAAENEVKALELPYRQKMAELQPYIEQNALEVEGSFTFAGVDIKYRSGYDQVRYDTDKIDALVSRLRQSGQGELAEQIEEARIVKAIRPSAKVATS